MENTLCFHYAPYTTYSCLIKICLHIICIFILCYVIILYYVFMLMLIANVVGNNNNNTICLNNRFRYGTYSNWSYTVYIVTYSMEEQRRCTLTITNGTTQCQPNITWRQSTTTITITPTGPSSEKCPCSAVSGKRRHDIRPRLQGRSQNFFFISSWGILRYFHSYRKTVERKIN